MEDDDVVAQFTSITNASPETAAQYLQVADFNLEQAVLLFFESDGNLDATGSGSRPAASTTRTQASTSHQDHDVMVIDSDEDDDNAAREVSGTSGRDQDFERARVAHEDDETIARRLQEEIYGAGADDAGFGAGVRAPMARTTETLIGGPGDWREAPNMLDAAVAEQMMARSTRTSRPGIFNQRPTAGSIWEDENGNEEMRRRNLSRATAGASDRSSKSGMLAEMYRPPTELISPLNWDSLRDEGKENLKWILVDVQDAAVFDCQVLNRDIWKNAEIRETVREHFLFKQYSKDDPAGQSYINYYFHAHESQDAYPHIAIVDPRTGEQVKVWSGAPPPKPMDFLMQLHEFLDRYSLKAHAKNPVAKRKPEPNRQLDVSRLTEDEALELAMQNSLGGQASQLLKPDDPDDLTRSVELGRAGPSLSSAAAPPSNGNSTTSNTTFSASESTSAIPAQSPLTPTTSSPFAAISSQNPHTEPPSTVDPSSTTRIQFRHAGGRVVRRFALTDPVRRLYEWLKADPTALSGSEVNAAEFELIFMGRNLIDRLDESIADAGLRNGSVMVEFTGGD